MKSTDVRNTFINYFKKHGHAHEQSSSLIPDNDPTLLFTNAGMNQFKNLFLGLEHRDYKRAVTSQKCVRAGGKHNDLENVGYTARHHTFFEMLGNFSFGDYFKKDAIHFAWELLTKEFGIPKEKLYVTVFETDDEAADIWHKQEGVPRDRIFKFGEKDNFWRMGDVGPCGPSSEIFYDHGPKAGKETDPFKGIASGEDRFIEIWNLVFMQFDETAPGKMTPLPKPSVDTGSGLERVVAAMQGQFNNYNTDLFLPMIDKACRIGGLDYVTDIDVLASHKNISDVTSALRVLADHSRSTAFLIADGALPSNEGRGYVLRRIMRRAMRYGQKLSPQKSLMPAMIEILIETMSSIYPELKNRKDHILNTVRDEETRFLSTLEQGTGIFMDELKKIQSKGIKTLPGEVVFKLYDTYGFPVDLTRVMANEHNVHVDENAFEQQMDAARLKAKASWKGKGISADEAHLISLSQEIQEQSKSTQFTGYEQLASQESQVLSLSSGTEKIKSLNAGDSGLVILNITPFYAEGGGQAGDTGILKNKSFEAKVHGTTKKNDIFIHHIEVLSGTLKVGEVVQALISEEERRLIAANHSATHLLHSALRKILGDHVGQAGSQVDAQKLRFDYTHNKPMTAEEIQKVEDLVNAEIAKGTSVSSKIMNQKAALESGAIAMFGEKYGDQVRVIKMGEFSTELCGGTHVSNTSQIRIFKLLSESGVSAGVRRVEAITSDSAFKYMNIHLQENLAARSLAGFQESWMQTFEGNTASLTDWMETKKNEIKNLEKEIKKLKGGQVNLEQILAQAKTFNAKNGEGQFIWADLQIEDRQVLSDVADHLKNKVKNGIIIVLGTGDSTHPLIVSVTKELSTQFSAGNLLKELAPIMGGKGGGRPDFAQGAVPDRTKAEDAHNKVKTILGC
jgi:alanyl-tRNA synthetase